MFTTRALLFSAISPRHPSRSLFEEGFGSSQSQGLVAILAFKVVCKIPTISDDLLVTIISNLRRKLSFEMGSKSSFMNLRRSERVGVKACSTRACASRSPFVFISAVGLLREMDRPPRLLTLVFLSFLPSCPLRRSSRRRKGRCTITFVFHNDTKVVSLVP